MKSWTIEEEARALAERFKGVNQAAFARDYRVPGGASMVNQHTHARRPMSLAAAIAYAAGFNCSLSEISPRLAQQVAGVTITDPATGEIDLSSHPDLVPIRRVKLKLEAGMPGFGVEPEVGDGPPIFFRKSWLGDRGYKSDFLLTLKVRGSSMEPTLYADDLVVINTLDREPKDGRVFAVNYEGDSVIKRLYRNDGTWWLTSDNHDKRRYPDKKWADENAHLIGLVIHRQSEIL